MTAETHADMTTTLPRSRQTSIMLVTPRPRMASSSKKPGAAPWKSPRRMTPTGGNVLCAMRPGVLVKPRKQNMRQKGSRKSNVFPSRLPL